MEQLHRRSIRREFSRHDEHPYDHRSPGRWILSHIGRYPHLPLAVLAASVLNNFAYSYIQLFVGRGLDRITTPGWLPSQLLSLALAIFAAATVQGITGLGRNFGMEFLGQRVERDARDELYTSLLGKSQTYHGRQRLGDIMARATNDVRMLNLMISPGLMLILDASLAAVVPLVLIPIIHPRLLLVPALFIPVLAVTIWDYNRRLKPASTAERERFGHMNAHLAEAVSGIEVVKTNTREIFEWRKFTRNARAVRHYFVKQGVIQAAYFPMLAFTVAWAAAFLHAMLLWRAGEIGLGQAVGFMGLVGAYRFPTFISIFSFSLVQQGVAGARRVLRTIATETELDENVGGISRPVRGEVVFEGVGFAYDGKPVLRDVTFRVEPGQAVAIVGQTGSGKTTLTRLINRIYDTAVGRVLVDNTDVRAWSLEALRSQISTIEQDVFLFSATIRENIAFGLPDATPERIEAAAREAQAHPFILELEHGYETVVGERGVMLSGGQKQRIAIARAFLTNPRILILDDSTSAVDSATEDEIQRALFRVARGRTTFLITHRLSQVRWADKILVLKRGALTDAGRHEELLDRSVDYRRIFLSYG
jgi:ATP-binding cassette subfamily B protein